MFTFLKSKSFTIDMRTAQKELNSDSSIKLIDVRNPYEFREGHIPDSINIPLDKIEEITDKVPDKKKRIFVYCLSGARSASALSVLRKHGYTDVTNIGGIAAWPGKLER